MDIDASVNKVTSFIKGLLPYVVLLIIVLLFKNFIMTPIKVNGNSMAPTLDDGDIMILDIISTKVKKIERFEIVVIDQGKELLIKRVIGLPGETIEYRGGYLYVNGKEVDDPFYNNFEFTEDMKVTVPEGEYFVLGDNRHNSLDSRTFGTFSKKQIKGKSDFIIYPFYRAGFIEKISKKK